MAEVYSKNEDYFTFTKDLIKRCDLGIKDIVIRDLSDEDDKKIHITYFVHNVGNQDYEIHYKNESSGTKNLYNQLLVDPLVSGLIC